MSRRPQTGDPAWADTRALLALAGAAAHASERTAAPIACWLAATVQVTPDLLELDVFGARVPQPVKATPRSRTDRR